MKATALGAAGIEQDCDDAHGLLGVVTAVPERVKRCGHKLQVPEPPVHRERERTRRHPGHGDYESHRNGKAGQRRHHNAECGLNHAGPNDCVQASMGNAGAKETPNQRMRAARREGEKPARDVPHDCPDQRAENHARVNGAGVDDAGPEGLRDVQPEYAKRDEIEKRRPKHRCKRPQHASRDYRCNRVRRVMETIEKVKGEGEHNKTDEHRQGQRCCRHRPAQPLREPTARQACSRTMLWISFPMSSKQSTRVSRRS